MLSIQAYGHVGRRFSSDIDILISKKNLHDFESALKMYGFNSTIQSRADEVLLLSASHQTAPWLKEIKPWGKIFIDLNFNVFWGEYSGRQINIDEFLSDTIEMNIYGTTIKVLPPLKSMVQLILHHYKDMNSLFLLATSKSIKYNMFQDIYFLLKNNINEISLNALYAISSKYQIIPYVFYILYFTGEIFQDEILKQFIEAFRTREGEELLKYYGLCDKERKEWRYDFKTRLESNNLYDLIKNDLTEMDKDKIAINKRIFLTN